MGTGGVQSDTEILAQCGQLEIRRQWLLLVLVKIPYGSLEGAEHLVAGGKEGVKPLVPGLKKWAIEIGIVGDKLRYVVGPSIRGKHWECGVAAKEVGESICNFLGFKRLFGPETSVVVVPSKAIAVGFPLIKANFGFKRLQGFKVVIDGYCGNLNNRVSFRV